MMGYTVRVNYTKGLEIEKKKKMSNGSFLGIKRNFVERVTIALGFKE